MKKKIIIASAVLIVLAGGFGITHVVRSHNAAQATSNQEIFYNEESNEQTTQPMENNGTDTSQLPSRDEVVTTPDSIFCLVNKEYSLPSNYEPNDLVVPNIAFSIDYESEKKYLRKVAAEALEQLFADAAKEELEIVAVSGYRSYTRQKEIYENNLKTRGTTHTNQYSAKPGYSEHQTGLVMDVSCKSEHFALRESFAETPEGIWLAENASKYGFIIRYPEGKSDITGYAYEPWHIRYVGVPMATYLVDNNLTLDEYFHYEPSYTFITDESAYINDTPENDTNTYNYSSAPSTTVAPTTTTNANQSGSTTQQKPSKVPVASKAPVTTTQAPTVTPEVTTQVPVEETVAPTEESTPTPAPSIEPSNAPSVAPSTVAPSKPPSTVAPPPENTDDVVTEAEGSLEES